jgi:hypothetical protein
MDIINHYAEQKALLSQAVAVNALNSKLFVRVRSEKQKHRLKAIKICYDKFADGEPRRIYR